MAAVALFIGAGVAASSIERIGAAHGRRRAADAAGRAWRSASRRRWRWCPASRGPGATIAAGMALGLRREAAARFTFLMSMPAILAAAAKEALELRGMTLGARRRRRCSPSAWRRPAVVGVLHREVLHPVPGGASARRRSPGTGLALALRRRSSGSPRGESSMWTWLRRSFITGFFVTVPLVVSVVAIVWVFRLADGLTPGSGRAAVRHARAGSGLAGHGR